MAKRGRPKNDPPTKARCVRLTDEQVRLLRMWGRGDVSAGLRWLIDAAKSAIRRAESAVQDGQGFGGATGG